MVKNEAHKKTWSLDSRYADGTTKRFLHTELPLYIISYCPVLTPSMPISDTKAGAGVCKAAFKFLRTRTQGECVLERVM
jgi:hypothetical protein